MPFLALAFRVHTQATASRHDDRTPSRRLGFLVRRRHDSTKNNPRLRHTHTRTRKRCLLLWPVRDFPRCRCLSLPGGFAAGVGKSHQNIYQRNQTKTKTPTTKHTHTHTHTHRERLTACSGRRSWPSRTTSQSFRRTGSGTSSCKYPPGSRPSRPAACTWCTSSSARA